MKIDAIIIDANLIVKNYNTFINGLHRIIQIKNFYDLELCIPAVVYDECIFNYENDINICRENIRKAFDIYDKTLINIHKTKIDINNIFESFEKKETFFKMVLDGFMSDNHIHKIDYPEVSHSQVVSDMYKKKRPFHRKTTEEGYKDYLIICSIKEYQNKKNKENVILYTKNEKDFSSETKEGVGFVCETNELEPKIYVTSKIEDLLMLIKNNVNSSGFYDVFSDLEYFNNDLGKITTNNIIFFDCLYGDICFKPIEVWNENFSTSDVTVNIDNDFLTVIGKFNLIFSLNFQMNSFEYEELDDNFIFYEKITQMLKKEGCLEDDFWEYKFHDYKYNKTVNFEYLDFEYKDGKYKDKIQLDDTMLTLSNIY